MIFSSIIFLCVFLPLFIWGYWLMPNKLKNFFILFSSIIFYSWGAPKFIFVILATTTIDFYLVNGIHNSKDEFRKKLLMILSLSLNLGLLFYFKYCNFFIDNINLVLNKIGIGEISWVKVVLPIGISFYTFESITYMVDVYRGIHRPLTNFLNYQLYILLFPKLIAGPIIRYHEISNQIEDRTNSYTIDNSLSGFYRFIIGLSKKVLIANVMASKADEIFNLNTQDFTTPIAWLGMFAYTMQIYFDFSGYSDMAIGIGKMIGFQFPENFNNPYSSFGITDFWRRWHITLGSWMRNYLYIPLGGNKVKSNYRLYFNLWIVFLASGFWHGASWTFILWGAYHGFFLVLERMYLQSLYKKLNPIIVAIITFIIVGFGWVIFRTETLFDASRFYRTLFGFNFKPSLIHFDNYFIFISALAVLFSFFILLPRGKIIQEKIFSGNFNKGSHFLISGISLFLFYLCITCISGSSFNPFIYFRF